MDELLHLLSIFIWRRVIACIVIAVVFALAVGLALPSIAAPLVLTAAILGTALGLFWESSADAKRYGLDEKAPEPKIYPAIAFIALALVGIVWAGLLAFPLGSLAWSTAAVGLSPYLLAPLIRLAGTAHLSLRQQTFASVAITTGPLLMLLLTEAAAVSAA